MYSRAGRSFKLNGLPVSMRGVTITSYVRYRINSTLTSEQNKIITGEKIKEAKIKISNFNTQRRVFKNQ